MKGGGACHLREKVLAEAAKTYCISFHARPTSAQEISSFILVADHRKNVEYLGTNVRSCYFSNDSKLNLGRKWAPGVPIEVVPFAYAKVLQNLHHILGSPNATLRMAVKKGMPFITSSERFY